MISSIIGFILVLVGLTALALQRFYSSIPAKELRRLAARGDHLAAALYKAVAYGASLRLFLWMVVSGALTGGILLLAQGLPAVAAFVAIAAVLVIGFVVLQSAKLTVRTAGFAAASTPVVAGILGWVEPLVGKITHTVHRRRTFIPHSGLYEKEDLLDLLDQQKNQSDNRIGHDELELARRALHFNETQAAEVMTPRTSMKSLQSSDAIGPILLEELYKSGQNSFVVYDGETAVGILQLQEALKVKAGGKVSAIMSKDLVFVHEDFTLRQVIDACLKTAQPLVIVINAFEEMVGVISLESLVNDLFGGPLETDMAYGDRSIVAAYKATEKAPAGLIEQDDVPVEMPADSAAEAEVPSSEAPEVVK